MLGCAAFVYVYPRHWAAGLVVASSSVLLILFTAARRRIKQKGGIGLWFRWTKLRLRPAMTEKAKGRKAADIAGVVGAIEKVHKLQQRETEKKQRLLLRREVRKIGAAMAPMRQRYAEYAFVEFRFLDNGACFCITDDQPYAHQDIYAILADVKGHRWLRRKVFYTLRKGQMLEDKEVFPAHVAAQQITNLKRASKVLNKALRRVISEIASRTK